MIKVDHERLKCIIKILVMSFFFLHCGGGYCERLILGIKYDLGITKDSSGIIKYTSGARVKKILANSVAEKIGLKVEDRILKINDKLIYSPEDILGQLKDLSKNDVVTLEIEREDKNINIAIGSEYFVNDDTDILPISK